MMEPNISYVPPSPLDTMAAASAMRFAARSVSFGGESDLLPKKTSVASADDPSDAREAALLLSFTSIAENEIRSMGTSARLWDDEDLDNFPRLPSLDDGAPVAAGICSVNPSWTPLVQPRLASPMMYESTSDDNSSDSTYTGRDSPIVHQGTKGAWKRLRAVSIDAPPESPPVALKPGILSSIKASGRSSTFANIVSPLSTPVLLKPSKLPMRKAKLRQSQKAKRNKKKPNTTPLAPPAKMEAAEDNKKRSLKPVAVPKGKTLKTILRKKFSWKNYPELEAFLITNREEYLRHSALNYTVQQKQYNNRLTERLLELAAEHGYVFDDVEFSFVTVRDRIRCYFKSYVQSAKKRGIIIGYAARKAGLLTTDDLEKSANQEGTISG
ncbi:expressed unknown protein [Seminavis robusta]|uniref:Uncharacterized protein n=1 Tax=Seminavis robusta TaxID=568900 RepID=A0A9N8DF07_9STRA|nr:expressed unknown protein [Seminavis robusta]|eukprot:Sro110_g054730.1 n/a (383) ;mRNA; f:4884-6130